MQILEDYDITKYSTFHLPAKCKYFGTAYTEEDIVNAYKFSKKNNIEIFPIGSGSNVVFGKTFINKFILEIQITGIKMKTKNKKYIFVVGSGENWDNFVDKSVSMNLAGIECLSAIPGTVGGTPVQNVGAYGQEIKNTLKNVSVFDLSTGKFSNLTSKQCKFSYRDSIFKNEKKGKYIILNVTFELIKNGKPNISYESLLRELQNQGISNPSLQDVRNTVIAIRKIRLPDPSVVWNNGSFFKNPIVKKSIAEKIQSKYPEIKIFPYLEDTKKISAGWLIENCGLKCKKRGHFKVYKNNALVLIHLGEGDIDELNDFIKFIRVKITKKFDINLEIEPEILY